MTHRKVNRSMSARINRSAAQTKFRMEVGITSFILQLLFSPVTVPVAVLRMRSERKRLKQAESINYFGLKDRESWKTDTVNNLVAHYTTLYINMETYMESDEFYPTSAVDKAIEYQSDLARFILTKDEREVRKATRFYRGKYASDVRMMLTNS